MPCAARRLGLGNCQSWLSVLSGTMPDHEAGRTQGREKGRPEGDAAEAQRRRLPVRAEPRVSITRPVLSKPLKPLPYNRLRFNTSL